MSGLKEPTKKIVSILNTSFEPQIPSLNGSPEKKSKQKYCDVRSIELQDLENCDKVIDEVRKRLNMDHIKITSNKSKESHHDISIKNSQLQNFKQFNLKEEYQKKQLRLKKQLMVKENTFINSNQSSKANSLQQSKVDLEISRYLKEKAKIKKMQINYKNHILQSQRETTQARQRLRSHPKPQPLMIEDKFDTPSFLTSLPRNPILLKEKSEASQEQQVEENIYTNLQNYFFLREQQPLLRRQRISCRQCTSHTKRQPLQIERVEQNEVSLLNAFRKLMYTKSTANKSFNDQVRNLYRDRPITSSIRQRSCSLEQSKQKVQRLRTQAEKMRQTYLQKNNEQREWYQQLIWECPKNIGDAGDYILKKLKVILEQGSFIKSEDILDLINEIHSNEFYKFSFCFIKLILQIFEYFEIDREYLTNFIKFKVLLSNYQD